MALGILLASGGLLLSFGDSEASAQTQQEPNIVFILTDDLRYDDLEYMPRTRGLIGNQGMRFEKAFVSLAMCCPSRATIMRGQYAHNHGVWFNSTKFSPDGGWRGYKNNGNERDNVATRLRGAGYRTGLFGKYFNGYDDTRYVPRGWVDWFAMGAGAYYDYDVNDNGTLRHYGSKSSDYSTDVLNKQTRQFIGSSVALRKPFFAYVAPKAPHDSPSRLAIPAPRDRHKYDGERAPRPPSFNERDVTDKPPWIGRMPLLSDEEIAKINRRHQNRVESLQAVDDLVAQVVNKLDNAGVLNNTYIFFTSDNGWEQGEHRISWGKRRPYEESIHVPLLVRGPEVDAGSTTEKLVLNTDFLPTFTDMAGAKTPSYVDGRSLLPLLTGNPTNWRTAILLETRFEADAMSFSGIRTSSESKYLVYGEGFRELYSLGTDPHELANGYDRDGPPANLASRLRELKGCAGDSCRAAENVN
jgi:arylsulfatase A-like enzyme